MLKPEVKARALRLWLSGLTYRAINEKTGVSLGAMNDLVNEARKKAPDIDELRQLNIAVQKSGASVLDAARGARLLDRINQLGVSLERLEGFVNIVNKISSEHNVVADKFIGSAMKLMELETKTSKSYQEVVREFDDKQARVQMLDSKVKELDSQRVKIQGELSQAKEKLSKTLEELKHAISTKERLQRLGLEKTDALAEFIEDYQLLGFDAQEVQKLAEWRKSLAETGIDPDGLESFIRKRGPLEKQLRSIEEEIVQGKTRLRILSKMEKDLQRRVDDIQRIERILRSRGSSFACSHCGWVTLREVRRFEAQMALSSGQPLTIVCQRCLTPNQYDPRTLLLNLGFEVLS
jgi:hypothetical protein